jgi:hypothetical protein
MLLNLEYSLQCDAYVGTLASNWCRIVDEMRATVGNDQIHFQTLYMLLNLIG